jgi:UDP-N-acetylmuramoyl-tripeptide--D-alanyl-D-alanine ligase
VGPAEGGFAMTPDKTLHTCWTPAWIHAVTGGEWLCPPVESDVSLTGLGIDSRSIKPGQVFLAVKGDLFDGHKYVVAATKAGATIAVIEHDDEAKDKTTPGLLLVDNSIDALHRLARAYREVLRSAGCRVIAVVGSNGKTTTRHLIHTVLSSKLDGTQSPKSFNNHLGVPLTLLGAAVGDRYVVAEVGTNHPGEIDALSGLLQPDSAVITCIGKEHLEFFGDLHGVAKEEAAILRHLPSNGEVFIESDAYVWIQKTEALNPNTKIAIYGLGSTAGSQPRQSLAGRQRFPISDTVTIDLPLIAPHDLNNALAAVEVGRSMGVSDAQIKTALEQAQPMPGRLEVKHFGPVTVIDDTYNANPDSTVAALKVLADFPVDHAGRRIVVLGDMLELGDSTDESHREAGNILSRMSKSGTIHHITLIGPCMALAADELAGAHPVDGLAHHMEIDADTPAHLAALIRPHDVVLYKGSRGMQLENLLPALRDRFAG